MHDILARVARGELSPADAEPLLRADRVARLEDRAALDVDRHRRGGIPEVVLAGPKPAADVAGIAATLLDATGQVCISRMRAGHRSAIRRLTEERAATVIAYGRGSCRLVAAATPANGAHQPAATTGHIGLIAAGTSDLEALAEARMVCEAAGCTTTQVADVGVAGLHRLFDPLAALLAEDVDALVVAAGMDGALPSVVSGLVHLPVIGLPTSTGYGAGGKGEAALLSMLQTCAPGLTVVNVDNGVGAGAAAVRIALQRRR
ncbi:MAG TPA: nickel pincer cofactor biosynthesis protein LarB [Candidatus Angelobacter sp.]|jgi:NCAIR mutase (PurE)-related protein|nr:nickel pincer cofactor biosynthesis protein LarB [Candidatus Angelobacter sp.]